MGLSDQRRCWIIPYHRLDRIVSSGLDRIVSYRLDWIVLYWMDRMCWLFTGWMVRMELMGRWWDGGEMDRR